MIKICSLGSGSKGNSLYININGYELLIDAGFSYKRMKARLASINQNVDTIKTILVSHQHSDHNKAVSQFQKKTCAKIYNNQVQPIILTPNIKAIPFILSHSVPCLGYRIEFRNFSIVYVSDTGCVPEAAMRHLFGASVIVFEFNYDLELLTENQKYPTELIENIASDIGHMDNVQSGRILAELNHPELKFIIPWHLSEKNNNPALVKYEAQKHANCPVVCSTQDKPSEVLFLI